MLDTNNKNRIIFHINCWTLLLMHILMQPFLSLHTLKSSSSLINIDNFIHY